jgi:adenine/guanine phosphoribosyltransferase-like PRPP-binding protein
MHANYIKECFNRKDQDQTIRDIKTLITKHKLQFDGFIVTGISGIVMGSILCRILRKDLVIVRKDGDGSHSTYSVENYKPNKKYIFLDDLVCSGKTFRNVEEKMNVAFSDLKYSYLYPFDKKFDKKSKIIGKLLYSGGPTYDPIRKSITKVYQLKTKI